MSLFNFLFNIISRTLVAFLVVLLSVNYLPDSLFQDFPLQPKAREPNNFDLIRSEWNTKLSDGHPEYIQLNNILGPESVAIADNGLLYTGLADGRLVELDPKKNYAIRTVTRATQNPSCQDNVATKATECGRFLLVKFVNQTLYAVEANTGLYKIDIERSSKVFVGPKSLSKLTIYNSFAVDPINPNLFFLTVSSTKWDLLQIMWSFFDLDWSGQVIAFDVKTGKRAIVIDNLALVNGIDVDVKRDRIVFAETMRARISYINLSQIREAFGIVKNGGKLDNIARKDLIELVPGMPDNVVIKENLMYIALPFVKNNRKEFADHLATMPEIRKAIGRFLFGVGKIVEYVHNNFFPHPILESIYRELKCGHVGYRFFQANKSAVIEHNLETGASRLLGSELFGFLSEAMPDGKGNLYLGSFRSPFLVKQKLVQ